MAECDVTAEYVRELFHYDPATGVFTWKKPKSNRTKVGSVAGSPNNLGYVYLTIDWVKYRAHRVAWLYVYGSWPDQEIDHINGLRSDNRIANLRQSDRSLNMLNTAGKKKPNMAGLYGVRPSGGKFTSGIVKDGKYNHLGTFDTAREASSAYENAKLAIFQSAKQL
jgi:hypothetical protein